MNASTTPTVPCLRCRESYEPGPRLASRFCPRCRRANKRDRNAAWVARKRANEKVPHPDERGKPSDATWMPRVKVRDPRRFDTYEGVHVDDDFPFVVEQPLPGANSPAGPREGVSTYDEDFDAELYGPRSAAWWSRHAALDHPWWSEHPHWAAGLHVDDEEIDFDVSRAA